MAERGKPIPIATRLEIKDRRQSETVRRVAEQLQVSKTTVQKYGTRPLQLNGKGE